MPTKEIGDIVFGILNEDGEFRKIGKVENMPEISDNEMVETSEIPDFTKGWELDFSLEPPKNHKELKKFVEAFHPSLTWLIWWTNTYGCNNWRKMHGIPMNRRMRK